MTTRPILFAPYIFHYMTAVRGMTKTEFAVLQAVYYYTVVFIEVPSGVVADRLGRRATLLVGALVNGLGCFLFALSHDFWTFALGEVLFALGTALISGADSALLYDSLAAGHRQAEYPRAEGAAQASWLVAGAIGLPLTDLFLVRGEDPVLAYWVTGGLSLLGCFCALAMAEPPLERRLSTREITAGALRDVVRIPGILRLIVYSIGVFVLLRAAIVTFLNPCLDAAGVPVRGYGTVLAVVNVVGAVAAWKAHAFLKRYGERPTLLAMPISLVIMCALLIPARVPVAAALFCIQGAVFGVYPLVTRNILNRLVPSPHRRATTLSIESMACRVAFGVVVVASGYMLDNWSLGAALAATTALACVPFLFVPLLPRPRADGPGAL